MKLLLVILLIFPQFVLAGQGRDGGWPQSIQLLRVAKQNLLELLAQSSDQDVKDALNGMKDRDEAIKVENVNLALVKSLVGKLENPDVLDIENSTYQGVRLFEYESNPIKVFATKNFFALERYQVQPNNINAALLKEVQTLILHEISHLWGFGEENGEMNYARTFAVRMVNILHGSLKVNFTSKERVEALSKAYFHETTDIKENNFQKLYNGKLVSCLKVTQAREDESFEATLKLDLLQHSTGGYYFEGNENSILRLTLDGFLLSETTHPGAVKGDILSSLMKMQGLTRGVDNVIVCHEDQSKLDTYIDRLVRPFYSRSNLFTDYANASQIVFQSLLIQDILFYQQVFESAYDVNRANQKQIIQNVDFRIKVQHADSYNRLIKLRSKYSSSRDDADMDVVNSLLNSGVSIQGKAQWSQLEKKSKSMDATIQALKSNPSRQLQMHGFIKDFIRDFNGIIERGNELDRTLKFSFPCSGKKRIGEFYACQIEQNKLDAMARIDIYKMLSVEMDSLVKTYTNRANALQD